MSCVPVDLADAATALLARMEADGLLEARDFIPTDGGGTSRIYRAVKKSSRRLSYDRAYYQLALRIAGGMKRDREEAAKLVVGFHHDCPARRRAGCSADRPR